MNSLLMLSSSIRQGFLAILLACAVVSAQAGEDGYGTATGPTNDPNLNGPLQGSGQPPWWGLATPGPFFSWEPQWEGQPAHDLWPSWEPLPDGSSLPFRNTPYYQAYYLMAVPVPVSGQPDGGTPDPCAPSVSERKQYEISIDMVPWAKVPLDIFRQTPWVKKLDVKGSLTVSQTWGKECCLGFPGDYMETSMAGTVKTTLEGFVPGLGAKFGPFKRTINNPFWHEGGNEIIAFEFEVALGLFWSASGATSLSYVGRTAAAAPCDFTRWNLRSGYAVGVGLCATAKAKATITNPATGWKSVTELKIEIEGRGDTSLYADISYDSKRIPQTMSKICFNPLTMSWNVSYTWNNFKYTYTIAYPVLKKPICISSEDHTAVGSSEHVQETSMEPSLVLGPSE